MSRPAVFCFHETAAQAARLAAALRLPCLPIAVRAFPDGESLVRVEPSPRTALLYRSLDHPNAKLVELFLAASALRANGARRVVLIAPYLGYMRQDRAFRPGEAISQRVVGLMLAERFDGLLTVDPHLHRTPALSLVAPGIQAVALSAAPVLSASLDVTDRPLLVGPDREARQWVDAIAAPLELETMVGTKRREGDRRVAIHFPDHRRCKNRRVVLVDDLVSSGATLAEAATQLRAAGAAAVEALATHCIAGPEGLTRMTDAGIVRIRASDSVPGPVASLPLAPLVAREIRRLGWTEE